MNLKGIKSKGLMLILASVFVSQVEAVDYRMKLGVATPTKHPHSLSAKYFAKLVKEKTDGKVAIKVFDNASLGNNSELLDAVKTGIVDFTVSTPGNMATYAPITGLLELPYIFASKDHMIKVTRGSIGKEIADTYTKETGIELLGYFGGAQRNMITKTKAINSIEDLSGMKMRTWNWKVMLDWWKSLGALGAVVPFPEVYTSLQTGVVDGAENEFSTFTTARWAEVAKNISLTQHSITVRPLVGNLDKLSKLPVDIQKAIRAAALEAANYDVKLEGELDETNLKNLKADYNVKITTPNKAPFIEASTKVINEFAKEKGLEDIAKKIMSASK